MKKILIIIITLFFLTGCNKDYKMTCTGTIKEETNEYKLNVTIHYDKDDKVKTLDYEMIYNNIDDFNKACEEAKDKDPKCDSLTVKYSESDEITQSFSKKDVKNMLTVIGLNECKED